MSDGPFSVTALKVRRNGRWLLIRNSSDKAEPRDLVHDDAYRLYLISRAEPPIVHHSAAMQWKRMCVLARRVRSFFASMRVADLADRARRRKVEGAMRHHRAI